MKVGREIGLYFDVKEVALNQYLVAYKNFQQSLLVPSAPLVQLVDFDFLVT